MTRPVLRTSLCDLLGMEYPIMLAGMGGEATPPELVAAVCNAGGFGVSGMNRSDPDAMRAEIRQIRALTDRPFGVDLLLPASRAEAPDSREQVRERIMREFPKHWAWVQELRKESDLPDVRDTDPHVSVSPALVEQQVEVVLEERVPLFCAALGDPSWLVPRLHEAGIKVLGLAGSARNAYRQMSAGVDIIAAQGYEAGGHTGPIATFPLIPEVVETVAPTPVVAGGGIADGSGVAAALCLGAVGAWCGTAFLFAEESRIGRAKQRQLLQAQTEDFVITKAYSGKRARDYQNVVSTRWEESGLEALPMPLQGVLMADFVEAAKLANRWDLVNNPAGQVAGRLNRIRPAGQIFEEMVHGAVEAIQKLQHSVVPVFLEKPSPS